MSPLAVTTTTASGGSLVLLTGTSQEVLDAMVAFKGNRVAFGPAGSGFFALMSPVKQSS